MDFSAEKIITNIVQIRNSKRLSQSAIADHLNVDVATVSRIESGKVALSYKTLADIASIFKMSVIDVITYPEVYTSNKPSGTKVLVELEVSSEEFIRLGLKDKVLQAFEK
jgi:transcriptional regulator with XRE-family HTH domain